MAYSIFTCQLEKACTFIFSDRFFLRAKLWQKFTIRLLVYKLNGYSFVLCTTREQGIWGAGDFVFNKENKIWESDLKKQGGSWWQPWRKVDKYADCIAKGKANMFFPHF